MQQRTTTWLTLLAFLLAPLATVRGDGEINPFDLTGDGTVNTNDLDFTGVDIADNPYNLNGDSQLDTADFLIFLSLFGTTDSTVDVNCDGTVNNWDFRAFAMAIYGVNPFA